MNDRLDDVLDRCTATLPPKCCGAVHPSKERLVMREAEIAPPYPFEQVQEGNAIPESVGVVASELISKTVPLMVDRVMFSNSVEVKE